jgi:hypothetical protein
LPPSPLKQHLKDNSLLAYDRAFVNLARVRFEVSPGSAELSLKASSGTLPLSPLNSNGENCRNSTKLVAEMKMFYLKVALSKKRYVE